MTRQHVRSWLLIVVMILIMSLTRSGHAQKAQVRSETPRVGFELVSTPVKRVRGALTFHVNGPKLQADEWTVIAARLPELPGQIDVRSAVSPQGAPAREHSEAGRPVFYSRIPADGPDGQNQFDIVVEYEATLVARKLVALKSNQPSPVVAPLDARTRRLELAQGRNFDFTSRPFQDWLTEHELRPDSKETEIDLARRVFLAIKSEFQYERREKMDRRASRICQAGKSDCGGMSIVFVSALRANKIPARLLTGRWAASSVPEGSGKHPNDQVHVKAEFFAQGVGWIPVDLSSAVQRDRSRNGLRYFGNDPGDFLAFHVDCDMIIDTYFGRKTAEWLQDPSYWAIGAGSFDGLTTRADWKVDSEPIEFREAVSRQPAGRSAPTEAPKSPKKDRRRSSP